MYILTDHLIWAGRYCALMSPPYVDTTSQLTSYLQASKICTNTFSFPELHNFDFSFYIIKVIGIGYWSLYGLNLNYLKSCNLHTQCALCHLCLYIQHLNSFEVILYFTLNRSQENQCIFLAIN